MARDGGDETRAMLGWGGGASDLKLVLVLLAVCAFAPIAAELGCRGWISQAGWDS